MNSKKLINIAGWIVFAIAAVVFYLSAERTGSLWDCGEFITGALKLEVVHPPGAALFLLIGRMFTFIAEIFSSNPQDISFSVNLMSGLCTAATAMFVCWTTARLGLLALVGRERLPSAGESMASSGAGIVAGLTAAFCTSIWFSAVEGEVYAMSTMFTAMTLWSMVKWYTLPNESWTDRWLIFTVYVAGLSIGVHLLSLLTFPALAMFYYFKKYDEVNVKGIILSALAGLMFIVFVQKVIIVGIPTLWAGLERTMVNSFGLPFHSGIFPLLLILGAIFYFAFKFAKDKKNALLQMGVMSALMVTIAFSTIGVVVIRANADTPINMNKPSDPMRLIPYLNREQYGERPLLNGPHFDAKPKSGDYNEVDRYGRVGDRYEITDRKISYKFSNKDKMFFPRIGHYEQGRPRQHKIWMDLDPDKELPRGRPNQADNFNFFMKYQVNWMYFRYFMWNFVGRQNGVQGYYPWDKTRGHWLSGIPFVDNRLYKQSNLPDSISNNKARNTYYFLPLLFGLLGIFFHFKKRPKDALALFAMFVITGLGIIIYSNQPPNEPRERDYVLAGSFFTFSIWVGMGVLAMFSLLKDRIGGVAPAALATLLALSAPAIMLSENFDDHSRRHHSGASDYASNFLESCEPNAIIFTYGDNDTYPLWYAQEVEQIRTDVRVVNLSLIAVDWYINSLRRKVNDSAPIKMVLTEDQIRGRKRVQVPLDGRNEKELPLSAALKFLGEDHPIPPYDSYFPAKKLYIPVDKAKALSTGMVESIDSTVVDKISFSLAGKNSLIKGDMAVLDIISSNLWDRPIYFAVTCRPESLLGLGSYLELEGLGMRIVPRKNKSDSRFGIIGSGSVDSDAVYNNVMNKFKWGNFDKKELFVDRSYLPSVQSIRLVITRACEDLMKKGDKKKAGELAQKFFEAFPHMNFPFDEQVINLMNVLANSGDLENAKIHMRTLANEVDQYLGYFEPYSVEKLQEIGFIEKYAYMLRAKEQLIQMSSKFNDDAFAKEIEGLIGKYKRK